MAGDDEGDEENHGWTEDGFETDAEGSGVVGKKEIAIISKIAAAACKEAILEYQEDQDNNSNDSQYEDEEGEDGYEGYEKEFDEDGFEIRDGWLI